MCYVFEKAKNWSRILNMINTYWPRDEVSGLFFSFVDNNSGEFLINDKRESKRVRE